MKVGIKIFPNTISYIKKCIENLDFIEILAVNEINYSELKSYDLPYTVHNMHSDWGVNLCNPERYERNLFSLKFSLKLADKLNAKVVIVHPGLVENKQCTAENFVKLLDNFKDERIIIENMPFCSEKSVHIGRTYEEMKALTEPTGKSMCLDFGHSSAAAYGFKQDPVKFTKKLMELKIRHFHFYDGKKNDPKDSHLPIGDGELPLEAFKKMMPNDAWVTVETPHILEKQIKEIDFLKG